MPGKAFVMIRDAGVLSVTYTGREVTHLYNRTPPMLLKL